MAEPGPQRAASEPAIHPLVLVGLLGDRCFGRAAEARIARADVVLGAARHLDALRVMTGPPAITGEEIVLPASPLEAIDLAVKRRADGERVCVLASGDPGFFGLVRLMAGRVEGQGLEVHPAPSSVALAFARLGVNWDDAAVVSAHGRPLDAAVAAVLSHPKVAVLVSPDQPPEALGKALSGIPCGPREVAVCSRLGEPGESVSHTDLEGLAAGSFDPLSVVVVRAPEASRGDMGLGWGLSADRFAHRDGMVTKGEVRAVVLGKLALPRTGVLWDVGAGSGSVAVECSRLAPGLAVYAVERSPEDARRIRDNSAGTGVHLIVGQAPTALAGLPDPDRVFVGGGGIEVLEAVLARLRPEGVVVATYAALDRAAGAATRLGQLVQVAVSRGEPIGDGTAMRLVAENPVFICWGPRRRGTSR